MVVLPKQNLNQMWYLNFVDLGQLIQIVFLMLCHNYLIINFCVSALILVLHKNLKIVQFPNHLFT